MTERKDAERTHFGYTEVPVAEKRQRVGAVFTSVAERYDIMNDVMSLGIHRLWKALTVHMTNVRTSQTCLDLAAGTGDIAAKLAKAVGSQGLIVACDINRAMLSTGRDRLLDRGLIGNIDYVQADAEELPFADNSFDCATMAFGLRNVTHKEGRWRVSAVSSSPARASMSWSFRNPYRRCCPASTISIHSNCCRPWAN